MAKKDKKLNVVIRSNGTPEGSSLTVNGADVTKQFVTRRIYFSAYSSSGEVDSMYRSQNVYLSWDVEEKDDQGILKTTTYRLAPNDTILKGLGKGIGDSTDVQFDSVADENTFKITGNTKKLEDAVEIKDIEKPAEK